MRTGGPEVGPVPMHQTTRISWPLEDLIIEYKAALVIIHDRTMKSWG